jgi:chromate reductase
MTKSAKILAVSGSARSDSFNRQLLAVMARIIQSTGVEVATVELREFPLPIYDGDLESRDGIPQNALTLRNLLLGSDGLLIACPEYNGSVPALLKNTIDWCSRPVAGQDGLAPFRGVYASIVAASIGPFGGVRAIGHLRSILSKMGALVLADELAVPAAGTAFSDGDLANSGHRTMAQQIGSTLARHVVDGGRSVK